MMKSVGRTGKPCESEFNLSGWILVPLLVFFPVIPGYLIPLPDEGFIVFAPLLVVLIIASLFDLKYGIIPNWIVLSGIAGWIVIAVSGGLDWMPSLLSAALSFSAILFIRWAGKKVFKNEGMGMGDAKLVFVIGLFLGWDAFWVLYLAILTGGIWSIAGLAINKLDRKSRLPYAPFLLAGAILGLFLLPFKVVYTLWIK